MAWAVLWTGLLSRAAAAGDLLYTVLPGDHLWNIAQRYLKQPALALQLVQRNQIPDPYRIRPGTQVRIPEDWLRLQQAPVRVLAVSGDVRIALDHQVLRAAVAGDVLQAPLRLLTGAQGSASLAFADGSRALVLRDSELLVHTSVTRLLDQVGMVTLELLRGGIENDVIPRAAPGRRYEIRTPAAVAAVRGTRFRVHADMAGGSPAAHTEVLAGVVQVSNAQGHVTARASEGSVAQARQAPTAPMALLPAPGLAGLPARVEKLPAELPFAGVDGARLYRMQLAQGPGFQVAQVDEPSPRPRLQLRDLADGDYVVRVRAVDSQGLEGHSAEAVLTVHAQPEPPLLIAPALHAVVTTARPLFRWTQSAGSGDRLQIYADDSDTPLLDERVVGGAFQPAQDLAPGRYRWRMARFDPAGRQGPFGDMQAFEHAEAGPRAELAGPPGHQGMVLRWSPQRGVAGYRVQLAGEAGFDAPLLDLRTDDPEVQLPVLEPGLYQVRVRRIGMSDAATPWSDPQTLTVPETQTARWPLLLLLLPLVLF